MWGKRPFKSRHDRGGQSKKDTAQTDRKKRGNRKSGLPHRPMQHVFAKHGLTLSATECIRNPLALRVFLLHLCGWRICHNILGGQTFPAMLSETRDRAGQSYQGCTAWPFCLPFYSSQTTTRSQLEGWRCHVTKRWSAQGWKVAWLYFEFPSCMGIIVNRRSRGLCWLSWYNQ